MSLPVGIKRFGFLALLLSATPAAAQIVSNPFPIASSGDCLALAGDVTGTCAATVVNNLTHVTNASLPNSGLVNPSITLNGHVLSLGGALTLGYSDLAAGSIANGTTATTQSTGDASTKVATDAFVTNVFAPHVATNALLSAAAASAYPNGVWRDDTSVGMGAGPLFFRVQTGTCSANGFTSDEGICQNGSSGDSWLAAWNRPYDPAEFGADLTGATNSAASINAALADVPSGATIACTAIGTYLLDGSGTEVLLRTHPATLFRGCLFKFASTLGATTDIIRLKPALYPDDQSGWDIGGYTVIMGSGNTGTAGRHEIVLDTSTSSTTRLVGPHIHDISELPDSFGVTGGDFVHTVENASNTAGSIFAPVIEHNLIWHTIDLQGDGGGGVGDTITLRNNFYRTVASANTWPAFRILQVAGSGGIDIYDENISVNGTSSISSGIAPSVHNNIFENVFTPSTGAGFQLSITGGSATPFGKVQNNQFQSVATFTSLRLSSVSGVSSGQSVSGTSIPGGCTVVNVFATQQVVDLSCLATATIASGATITINGTLTPTTTQAAVPQALPININTNGSIIGPNYFGSLSGSPLITLAGSGNLLSCGNNLNGAQTVLSDSGTNTQNNQNCSIGTWTPTDASGASLTLTYSDTNYRISNGVCEESFVIVYPTTVSALVAQIGGGPCTAKNGTNTNATAGIGSTGATALVANVLSNTTTMSLSSQAGLTSQTNANMSTLVIRGSFGFLIN